MIISANGTRTFKPAPGRRYALLVTGMGSGVSVAVKVNDGTNSVLLDTLTIGSPDTEVAIPGGTLELVTTGLASGDSLVASIAKMQY